MATITNIRKWQQKAFSKLKGQQYGLLKAVTGSGKSVAVAKLAGHFYTNNSKRNAKVVVSVPNKGIGNNFSDIHILDGNIRFKPKQNNILTSSNADNRKTDALLQFMDIVTTQLEDSIVVCCHQTLLRAVQKNPEKFKNCLIVADEVHHSKADDENFNKLGKAIETLCKESSNAVLMVTATPFRSDGSDLFPSSIKDKVVKFSYSLSEYLADCEYLREIKYEGHFYDHVESYYEALKEYFYKNGIGKTIVFLPHVRLEGRRLELNNVLASALQLPNRTSGSAQLLAELQNPQQGPYRRINQGDLYWEYQNQETGRKLIVVDLDDDNQVRDHRLAWLSANKNADANTDYLLISLQVFIEGGDFPAVDKVINLSIDKSFLRMIQKWGRATRDYPNKSVATFVQFMNINEGYNLTAADSYNENQLEEMIGLQEADIDVVELQQISQLRGKIMEDSSKQITPNHDSSQDVGEVATQVTPELYSVTQLVAKYWRHLLAASVIGMVVGATLSKLM